MSPPPRQWHTNRFVCWHSNSCALLVICGAKVVVLPIPLCTDVFVVAMPARDKSWGNKAKLLKLRTLLITLVVVLPLLFCAACHIVTYTHTTKACSSNGFNLNCNWLAATAARITYAYEQLLLVHICFVRPLARRLMFV